MKKLIVSLILLIINTSYANEAVKEESLTATASYTREFITRDQTCSTIDGCINSNGYANVFNAYGSATLPILNTNYLGMELHLSRTSLHNKELNRKNILQSMTSGVDFFIRKSDIGGILGAFDYVDRDHGSSWSSNDYIKRTTIKGEYYFDKFTTSARYLSEDSSEGVISRVRNSKNFSVKYYPNDNFLLTASIDHRNNTFYDPDFNMYKVSAELQPIVFNKNLNLYLGYRWFDVNQFENFPNSTSNQNVSSKIIDTSITYYLSDHNLLNSTPAVKFSYASVKNEDSFSKTTNDIAMFEFGFMFDNLISLKDRDRKYLFSYDDEKLNLFKYTP